jgi:hypothetical protein
MLNIDNKLIELQHILDEINDWVGLIKGSQENAAEAIEEAGKNIQTVNKLLPVFKTITDNLEKDISKHTSLIDSSVKKYNSTTLEIQDTLSENIGNHNKELVNSLTEFDAKVKSFITSFKNTEEEIKANIEKEFTPYQDLAKETNRLVEYLRNVDFPARLDKIDTAIGGAQQSLNNLPDKIDRVKGDIIDNSNSKYNELKLEVNRIAKEQNTKIDAFEEATKINFKAQKGEIESLKIEIENNQKTQKTLSIITLVSIVIILILLIIVVMK